MENKKQPNRKRNIQVKFFVTEEELAQINQRLNEAEYKNKSTYLRTMALEGAIIKKDYAQLKEITKELSQISIQINQLAKQIEQGETSHQPIKDIKRRMDEIWQLLKSKLLSQL